MTIEVGSTFTDPGATATDVGDNKCRDYYYWYS